MAIDAHSTPAPTAHPRYLRGGNAPSRILSEAEVLALLGEGDITTMGPDEGGTQAVCPLEGMAATTMPCEGVRVIRMPPEVCSTAKQTPCQPDTPIAYLRQRSPAPLPSLTAAFAIRREVFGPVPLTDDGEVRALELHDVVPAGHIAVPITNARWSPHLKLGEFAILDVSDTEPQLGELYGLMIDSRKGPKLQIVQPYRSPLLTRDDGCVVYRFGAAWGSYADGPLKPEWWHRKCRGRVVGVLALPEVHHG